MDRQADGQNYWHANRQKDRQADRQTGTETERQKQRDRQTDREGDIDIDLINQSTLIYKSHYSPLPSGGWNKAEGPGPTAVKKTIAVREAEGCVLG